MRAVLIGSLVGILLGFASQASAQPGPGAGTGPGRGPGPNMERLEQVLGLSDAQTGQVETILAEQGKKRRALMQEARSGGQSGGVRDKMFALRDETNARLAAVLSDEQLAQYEKLAAERRARMRDRRQAR